MQSTDREMVPDRFVVELDKVLRTLFVGAKSERPVPGGEVAETVFLSESERERVVGLMRVNHSGEICAQALYQGQALTSRDKHISRVLQKAADEEVEHLAWTERRISELGGRKSFLNPLWYTGAFAIGAFAGMLGNKWNLGFLAETERQVEAHLDGHIELLPLQDHCSRQILSQMKDDEVRHAGTAVSLGAAELPVPATLAMKLASKVMTRIAYYF